MSKFDPRVHGVSFSLLEDWMNCRELARYRIQGIASRTPSLALTFGTLVHDCMARAHTDYANGKINKIPSTSHVADYLAATEKQWRADNPRASAEALETLEHAMLFGEAVMPLYFKYWRKHFEKVKWLFVEDFGRVDIHVNDEIGDIPFNFKMDGVYELNKLIWLHEQKTHSMINEGYLVDWLHLSLQVVSYLVALRSFLKKTPAGVNYSIIRRPGLRQGKVETNVAFAKRCADDIVSRPDWYFLKFEVRIMKDELAEREQQFKNLIAEFVKWHDGTALHFRSTSHCENKYGRCTFLPICSSGDMTQFYTVSRDRK